MPQADAKALKERLAESHRAIDTLTEIVESRRAIDLLIESITQENDQLREQCKGAAQWISRHAALAAMLIDAVLEIQADHTLSETQAAALAEYEKLHGSAVSERRRLERLGGGG
jgi:hypothetical protein